MQSPTFDADGYPTEETLQALRVWPHSDVAGALDLARAAWHWPDWASEALRPHELLTINAEPGDRFVRFATGGWSGNEAIIGALNDNRFISALCWQLSARGGLHIYEYPKERTDR